MDYSQYPHYELRRKFWKFFGAEVRITAPEAGSLIGIIKMKAFKLREDIRVYRDEATTQELLAIHARQIMDLGATYDVTDSQTKQPVVSLRRKGLKSVFVRDSWEIMDPAGNVIGSLVETSGNLALVRRWLGFISDIFDLIFAFVKQSYEVRLSDAVVAQIVHQTNPVVVKLSVDQSMAPAGTDGRITLATVSLLTIVEAAKN